MVHVERNVELTREEKWKWTNVRSWQILTEFANKGKSNNSFSKFYWLEKQWLIIALTKWGIQYQERRRFRIRHWSWVSSLHVLNSRCLLRHPNGAIEQAVGHWVKIMGEFRAVIHNSVSQKKIFKTNRIIRSPRKWVETERRADAKYGVLVFPNLIGIQYCSPFSLKYGLSLFCWYYMFSWFHIIL
jgi:hypothetical protein